MINKGQMRFSVRTFGCQMNVSDSEKVTGLLGSQLGWTATNDASAADVLIFNTCAVRQKAEDKLYSSLERLSSEDSGRRPLVVVGGCVAQLQGERLRERFPVIDVLVGPRSLYRLPELIANGQMGLGPVSALDRRGQDAFLTRAPIEAPVKPRALVTVMEGCNQVCSFCVVPRTRGTETCLSPERIVAEVASWVARGRGEIMLLGQTVNAYRYGDCRFADLLHRVGAIPGVRRLRFVTSHPRHVDEALAASFGAVPPLCPQFHLPVQSGSDRILDAMRRGYDRQEYLQKIALVRRYAPQVSIWTDVVVGYPGETDEDFRLTMDLLAEVRFGCVFAFTYSPRPGTTAASLPDDVPQAVKSQRLDRLNRFQQELQGGHNRRLIGSVQEVLVESVGKDGRLEGRSPHNRVVHCAGGRESIGRYLSVRITATGPNALVGEVTEGQNDVVN
jgi:tRNA-2-methylthio-N6-dimethylallyladenosine synthase